MSEDNKQKSKADWITAVLLLIIGAVLLAIFIFLKGHELYIGGVVINNVTTLAGIIFEIIVLLTVIIECLKNIRKTDDPKTRKKIIGSTIAIAVFSIIMIIFTSQVITSDVVRSNKAAIAEREIGDGKSVLLMENEESFSSSGDTFYEITV